jgi:hypothetical protein
MKPEDEQRVDRALDLLQPDKAEVDPAAFQVRIPEILEKANQRADEIVRARRRRRSLLILIPVAACALGAALLLCRLRAETRELEQIQALVYTIEHPDPSLAWTADEKALAAEIVERTQERLDRGDDAAAVHSQLAADLKTLRLR